MSTAKKFVYRITDDIGRIPTLYTNGVLNPADDIDFARADSIRIKLGGTFDGATVVFSTWLGEGKPDVLTGSDWEDSLSFTAPAVGSDGVWFNVGKGEYFNVNISGGGGSVNIVMNIWNDKDTAE
tara:strand:+ start:545 stop:919 length:375 start_codon:yes stop_codon:yes gene_type:complete